MNETAILAEALAFHGHKCWASTAGVRLGLAAMEALGAPRAGAKQLHAIIETGDYHGGMCFGDGIQFTTGCTFGKGNIEKIRRGQVRRHPHRQGLEPRRAGCVSADAPAAHQGNAVHDRNEPVACRRRRSPRPSRWRWSTSSGTRKRTRS